MADQVLGMSVALALLTGTTRTASAQPWHYESEYFEVTTEVVTPHVKWAKPYFGGPVRALFIGPRANQRDTVELAQRLDLELDAIGTWTREAFSAPEDRQRPVGFSPEEFEPSALEKLNRPHDVIVVGNVLWKGLPERVQAVIVRKLEAGTGLVLTYHSEGRTEELNGVLESPPGADETRFITTGIPFTATPAWKGFESNEQAAESLVTLRQFGRGRVVLLNFGESSLFTYLTPSTDTREIWYISHPWHLEYYLSLTAKAVLFAANKEPDVLIKRIGIGDNPAKELPLVKATGVDKAGVRVELSGAAPRQRLSVELTVRDVSGAVVYTDNTTATAQAAFGIPVGSLKGGTHFAEIVLRTGAKCVNWGTAAFTVDRPVTLGEVTANTHSARPGETVQFEVPLSAPAPTGSRVEWEMRDSLGRIAGRRQTDLETGAASARVDFALADPVANLLVVETTLLVGGASWSRVYAWLPVALPYPRDEFSFAMWGDWPRSMGTTWNTIRQSLYRLGVDTLELGGGLSCPLANLRLLHLRRIGTHPGELKEEDLVRVPCLSDPKHLKRVEELLTAETEAITRSGGSCITLGDDSLLGYTDICVSPHCLADLRVYLREQYGTLERLNSQWGTEFADWSEVTPTTLDKAKEHDQPSRWFDHRMHMESVYAGLHQFAREAAETVNPLIRVGCDGLIGSDSRNGYDPWKMSRAVTLWNVYPAWLHADDEWVLHLMSMECLRSFQRPGTYSGLWYGGYARIWRFEEGERWLPWYALLHQLNSVWWFKAFSDATHTVQEDALAGDLRPFRVFEASAEIVREIKRGPGKLLLGTRRDNCGIAVLYSQPSLHAVTYEAPPDIDSSPITYGHKTYTRAVAAGLKLLEDLGLQYDMVSYASLDEGILRGSDYRVLMLPTALAVSRQSRDEIARFVESGGTVIADVRPGRRDGHGRVIEDPAWDVMFGVAPTAPESSMQAEPRVTRRGSGAVVLLNSWYRDYKSDSADGTALRTAVGQLLPEASAKPWARLEVNGRDGRFEGELVTFSDGEARYVCALRDHSPRLETQRLCVSLPKGFHVYNMRTGEYAGVVRRVESVLGAGEPLLLALLPYRVVGPRIRLDRADCCSGDVVRGAVELQTRRTGHGRHVVHMSVTGPTGTSLTHYAQNIELRGDSANFSIPLALSDPVGRWRIECRDVATGTRAAQTFECRAPVGSGAR